MQFIWKVQATLLEKKRLIAHLPFVHTELKFSGATHQNCVHGVDEIKRKMKKKERRWIIQIYFLLAAVVNPPAA